MGFGDFISWDFGKVSVGIWGFCFLGFGDSVCWDLKNEFGGICGNEFLVIGGIDK